MIRAAMTTTLRRVLGSPGALVTRWMTIGNPVTCWRRRDRRQRRVWDQQPHQRLLDWLRDNGRVDWSRCDRLGRCAGPAWGPGARSPVDRGQSAPSTISLIDAKQSRRASRLPRPHLTTSALAGVLPEPVQGCLGGVEDRDVPVIRAEATVPPSGSGSRATRRGSWARPILATVQQQHRRRTCPGSNPHGAT